MNIHARHLGSALSKTALSCTLGLVALVALAANGCKSSDAAHGSDGGSHEDGGAMLDASLPHDAGRPAADGGSHPGKPHHDAGMKPEPLDAAVDSGDTQPDATADDDAGAADGGQDCSDDQPDASIADGGAETYPMLLSETGLFDDLKNDVLAKGVKAFQPKYVLWADGATKRRFLYLPPCKKIDTTNMDEWVYPVGTKAWKEFSVDGKRVETRMLYKSSSGWIMVAYQWKDDQSDAEAVPSGVPNASSTTHDIPAQGDCMTCHTGMTDRLLGVTAIQLSHTLDGLRLTDLIDKGVLSNPPAGPFTLPGDDTTQAALGYLHANCGGCHNPHGTPYPINHMVLWESTMHLGSVADTTAYTTTVGVASAIYSPTLRVSPTHPTDSLIIKRMSVRGSGAYPSQMPPLATKVTDTDGIAKVTAWIMALPALPDPN